MTFLFLYLPLFLFGLVMTMADNSHPDAQRIGPYLVLALIAIPIALRSIKSFAATPLEKPETRTEEQARYDEVKNWAENAKTLRQAKSKISSIVGEHLTVLVRRRVSTVRVDHYGVVEATVWQKEVQHFVDRVILPKLTDQEVAAVHRTGINSVFQELIEDRVANEQELLFGSDKGIEGLTPTDFEEWCRAKLEQLGWDARLTRGGGDQGADVVAVKGQKTVVLQCKLYTGAVGNKAVQEVFASARHYGATSAAVVTNASFTKSARELAASTGVFLLQHSELDQLAGLLGI